MKRIALLLLLAAIPALPQSISPNTPQSVVEGGSVAFTASGFTGSVSCSVTNASGTCSCVSNVCTYSQPSSGLAPPKSVRGIPLLPPSAPYYLRVDSLSVDSHSARWLNRVLQDNPEYTFYHYLRVGLTPLVNAYMPVVNNSTPTQYLWTWNTGNSPQYNNTLFPIPDEKNFMMESGRLTDYASNADRHFYDTNKDTLDLNEAYDLGFDFESVTLTAGNPTQLSWTTETIWPMPQQYQVYFAGCTGPWAALNNSPYRIAVTSQGASGSGTIPVNSTGWGAPTGCRMGSGPNSFRCGTGFGPGPGTCNTAGVTRFNPGSYAQYGGMDAAAMPISPLMAEDQELIACANTSGCTSLTHAIRTTFSNRYLSARSRYPAEGNAFSVAGSPVPFTCTSGNPITCTAQNNQLQLEEPCSNYASVNALASASVVAGGSGYHVGDVLQVNGGAPGVVLPGAVKVTSVSGTSITGVSLTTMLGTGYLSGTQSTTAITGAGSGATVSVTVTATCAAPVNITGLSGSYSVANGDQTATVISGTTFTLPYNIGSGTGSGTMLFDFFPYGAVLRLKSSFNVAGFCTTQPGCAIAKIYLTTLQKYGLVVADGTVPSDNWDSGTMQSEYHDDALWDADVLLSGGGLNGALNNIEGSLEVVDNTAWPGPQGGNPSNLPMWMQTTARSYITVTDGTHQASADIIPIGTAVGTDKERLTVVASGSQQINAWASGNTNTALNYALQGYNGGATFGGVTSGGLLTMPACTVQKKEYVVVTSQADSTARPLYVEAWCLPVGSDGAYRVAFGNYNSTYTDSAGNTWQAAFNTTGPNGGFNTWYESPGAWFGSPLGSTKDYASCSGDTWPTQVNGLDNKIYSHSMSANGTNDIPIEIDGLPQGNYSVTLFGEPGFGGFHGGTCGNTAGQNVFTLEVQGQVVPTYDYVDGYVLAGNQPYNGWAINVTAAVGSDGVLKVTARNRNPNSVYQVAIASLKVVLGNGPLITTTSLPNGTAEVAYSQTLAATGGVPPYSWSCTGLPADGLLLNFASGLISGTPTAAGTIAMTCTAKDHLLNSSPPANLSITIVAPTIAVSGSLPNGAVGQPYGPYSLSATGGVGPYTWCVLNVGGSCDVTQAKLPPGLTLTPTGFVSGTPTTAGHYVFSIRATDAGGFSGAKPFSLTIGSIGPTATTMNGVTANGVSVQ